MKNKGYRLLNNNEWFDNRNSTTFMGRANDLNNFTEATPKEVKKALIIEAKRRGFMKGCVSNNGNLFSREVENHTLEVDAEFEYNSKLNTLRLVIDPDTTRLIFKNGQWTDVLKQEVEVDKFADLKEAFKNGAEIEYYSKRLNSWIPTPPSWDSKLEYRIKPNQPTQQINVGDWVYYQRRGSKQIVLVNDGDNLNFFKTVDAKKIEDKELIEKLNSL